MHARWIAPWALCLALGLAACAAPEIQTGEEGEDAAPVTSLPSAPAREGTQPQQSAVPAQPAGALHRLLAEQPGRLQGLSAAEIVSVLGEPQLLRRDAPAQIWQYHGETCILDLFFYEDDGEIQVAHAAVRHPTHTPPPLGQCLRTLLNQQAAR
ncbi:hypothetical protein [Telmatospirillum sp. J64-1]|uniref:hypothetical protein n=1 Tax=Telmatospirillum sp. J64-1 TaxID=2502183 RepID=UPI00115F73F8|nr:hypothetical protein [Telmatospirillum sp. J64-1]